MKKMSATKAWRVLEKAWRRVLKDEPIQIFSVPDSDRKIKLIQITRVHVKAVKKMVCWNLRKHAHESFAIDDGVYYQRGDGVYSPREKKKEDKRMLTALRNKAKK